MNRDPSKIKYEMTLSHSFTDIHGNTVDFYVVYYDPHSETGISLGVPHGRKDIAEYIFKKLAN